MKNVYARNATLATLTSKMMALLCFVILVLCSAASSHAGTSISRNSGTNAEGWSWRDSLPMKLRDNQGAPLHRVVIQPQAWSKDNGNNTVTVYLLGTSHVSRTSCKDAELLMEHVRPDCLFVELCSQRVGLMLPSHETTEVDDDTQTRNKRQQHGMSPISQKSATLFAKIQNDYASKLNVTIGGEFRAAFQSALRQQKEFWNSQQTYHLMSQHNSNNGNVHPRANRSIAIVLGDRPVRITLLRAWESLRLFGKIKLVLALLWSSIKQPSEKELREWMESVLNDRSGKNDLMKKAMDEMARSFPTLKRVIIDERDEFMVAKIKQTAELLARSTSNDERVMVVVIGAGHCSGVVEKLLDTKSSAQPETVLPSILQTKRKLEDEVEGSDVVQFDYAYAIETGMI